MDSWLSFTFVSMNNESGHQKNTRSNQSFKKMRNNVNFFLFIIIGVLKDNIKANDDQRSLAKFTIDAGADAVIGSHPHAVQGTETYNENPLFIR